MKNLLILIPFLWLSNVGSAQRGMLDNAIGLRFGLGSGLTFQHFYSDHNVIELIAMQRYGGVSITGLYEAHNQAFDVRGLKWYIGGGAHAAVYGKRSVLHDGSDQENIAAFGLDGIIGIEYFMRGLPLQISVDWKPAINLYGTRYQDWDCGAMSIRYRF